MEKNRSEAMTFCYKCKNLYKLGTRHRCNLQVSRHREEYGYIYKSSRWDKLRSYVLHTYPICARCGSVEGLQLHHIVKLRDDITKAYEIDNVVLLCPKCHKYIDTNCKSGKLDFKFDKYKYQYTL